MKQRRFWIVLILVLLIGMMTVTASAAGAVRTGECGENVTWRYDSATMTLTLRGSGSTYDYDYHLNTGQSPLTELREDVQVLHIVVEPGITGLGNSVLAGLESAETLSLPDGLETIGNDAFSACRGLKEIVIPETVTSIGSSAFSSCDNISEIVIPSGVTRIEMYAFSGCKMLSSVSLPEGLEVISERAFLDCTYLKEIHLPDSLVELHGAFEGCINLETINLPPNLTIVNLSRTGITECVIPSGVTELRSTFRNCKKLERVVIPEGVTVIGDDTFYGCTSLKSVELPSTLKKIGYAAFDGSAIEELVIPRGVTYIGYGAFSDCPNLRSLTIPDTVTEMAECHSRSENLVINCWPDTFAMLYAIGHNIPYNVLPDEQTNSTFAVTGYYNGFGDVAMANDNIPAGRIGIVAAVPYHGCYMYSINAYDAAGNLLPDLVRHYLDDVYYFLMPDQNITLEILFNVGYPIFMDVPQDAYYLSPVLWASTYDITTGTSATTFSPDDPCTRGQVVTFLWRAAGCPEPVTANNPFADVLPDTYFYTAVLWAVENGITTGTSATTFSPDDPCTRAQVVTFLWRAAGEPTASVQTHTFTDIGRDYYYDAVLWALEYGITTGTSDITFSPDDPCTRAQVVTFLYRFLG